MKHVKTVSLIKEIPTDGHSPLQFLCDDGHLYYCKYRIKPNDLELDCLIYEAVCSALLGALDIPTPETAVVEIVEHTYDREALKANRHYIEPGRFYFGSREVESSDLVTELDKVATEKDFQVFENPEDLIRIAVFDLWVGNRDRGLGNAEYTPGISNNYNLLKAAAGEKIRLLAFDHGFAFEGETGFRKFNHHFPVTPDGKLFPTQFYTDFLKFLPSETVGSLIEETIQKIQALDVPGIVETVFAELPADWVRHPAVASLIIDYLSHPERHITIAKVAKQHSGL